MEETILELSYTDAEGFVRPMLLKKPQSNGYIYIICGPCGCATNPKKISGNTDHERLTRLHLASKSHQNKMNHLLDININLQIIRSKPPLLLPALGAQPSIYLGLEYVIEFYEYQFQCYLCRERSTGNGIFCHLGSLEHQINYLNAHFSSISGFINHAELRAAQAGPILDAIRLKTELLKIASEAIQKQCGQMMPKFLEQSIKRVKHNDLSQWIISEPHFDENKFPQLKYIIDENIVKGMVMKNLNDMFPVLKKVQAPISTEPSMKPYMKVAINISKELIRNGLEPTPEKLNELVNIYVNSIKSGEKKTGFDAELTDDSFTTINNDQKDLDGYDIPILIENFHTLNFDQQLSLARYLKTLSKFDSKKLDALRRNLSITGSENLIYALN